MVRDVGWCGAYGWVVEFRVLGPIEVYSDDGLVHVGGVKQRSILALLIANHGKVVSADRVVDEIYGDDAVGARRSVQTIISMLLWRLGICCQLWWFQVLCRQDRRLNGLFG